MSRCTFTATPLVWINIAGEPRDFPRVPDDGGLILCFVQWQREHDCYPSMRLGTVGGGAYSQGFAPADAEKVIAWLEQQGVIREDGSRG